MDMVNRTPVSEKAKQFIKLLKKEENVDYNYLREVFRTVRKELDIKVNSSIPKKLLMYQLKMNLVSIMKLFGNLEICVIWL